MRLDAARKTEILAEDFYQHFFISSRNNGAAQELQMPRQPYSLNKSSFRASFAAR